MPDLIATLSRWWKPILYATLIATLITVVIVALLPRQYLSVATALPANSATTDKAAVFGNSLQELYSPIGEPEELDRVLGTAGLDTLYLAVAGNLQLPAHYGFAKRVHDLELAAAKLKRNTRIIRNEYGELKVKVWDREPRMAAQIANALLQQLQQMHRQLQNSHNLLVLQKLKEDYGVLQQMEFGPGDSAGRFTDRLSARGNASLQAQLTEHERLISQYQLMVNTAPPALVVVENARPALYPDKPYPLLSVSLAFFGSAIFTFLLAVFIEGSRKPA